MSTLPGSGPGSGTVLGISGARALLIEGCAGETLDRIRAGQAALRSGTGLGDITIGLRPSGRPRLEPPYPELGVSLSHREDLVLVGFSPAVAVGVDLEIDTPALEAEGIAADYFSAGEAAAVASLQPLEARDLFLRLWVAKEAALKLTGRGIYDGLDLPDLSNDIGKLGHDGAVVTLQASTRLPAVQLAVCRVEMPARPHVYCALAVVLE